MLEKPDVVNEDGVNKLKCPYKICEYVWKPHREKPKACPKCKRYFGW